MAVGDIITGCSAAATSLEFQPASGVEVIITGIAGGTDTATGTAGIRLNLTVDDSQAFLMLVHNEGANLPGVPNTNMKIGITNAMSLVIDALAAGKFSIYTGIQVK